MTRVKTATRRKDPEYTIKPPRKKGAMQVTAKDREDVNRVKGGGIDHTSGPMEAEEVVSAKLHYFRLKKGQNKRNTYHNKR